MNNFADNNMIDLRVKISIVENFFLYFVHLKYALCV